MTFISAIQVERAPGSKGAWTLTGDLIYTGSRDQFVVPRGFETDFASIPRIFQSLIPKHGRFDAAAIIHDFLYRQKPYVKPDVNEPYHRKIPITRKDADGIFLRIMRELKVGWVRRHLIYLAVRVGGRSAWSKHEAH